MTGRETGLPENSAAAPGRRIRKDFVILSFSSYEQAMEMEDFCRASGIPGRLIPLPPKVHAGCGLCWRMDPEEMGPEKANPGKTDPGKMDPEKTDPEGHEAAVRAAVDRIRAAGLIFEGPHKVSMWFMEK